MKSARLYALFKAVEGFAEFLLLGFSPNSLRVFAPRRQTANDGTAVETKIRHGAGASESMAFGGGHATEKTGTSKITA